MILFRPDLDLSAALPKAPGFPTGSVVERCVLARCTTTRQVVRAMAIYRRAGLRGVRVFAVGPPEDDTAGDVASRGARGALAGAALGLLFAVAFAFLGPATEHGTARLLASLAVAAATGAAVGGFTFHSIARCPSSAGGPRFVAATVTTDPSEFVEADVLGALRRIGVLAWTLDGRRAGGAALHWPG